jgi:hypothetical protein
MGETPVGTVTFLFTNIEGSTRLWQEDEASMRQAVARHDRLLHDVVAGHGGVVSPPWATAWPRRFRRRRRRPPAPWRRR